jgi:hypothetical protein
MSPSKPDNTKIIKGIFVPSGLVMALYFMVSLTILGLLNLRGLWNISVGSAVGPIANQDISPITNNLDKLQDKINGPAVFLFWLLIGCIAYGITRAIQNVFMVAGSEVKNSKYMSGGELPQHNYWRSVLASNMFFMAVAMTSTIYLVLYLWLLLPACSSLFYMGIYHHFNYKGIIDCIGGTLLNVFAMYFLAIFLRITRYRWRTIRPNF